MEKLRRTKKVVLIEEFAGKIRNGTMPPGSFFPNVDELMRRHKISSGTAGKIISGLGKLGLLEISRGRRTKVKADLPRKSRPELPLPIGILSPSMEIFRHSRWREWMLHHLQRSLLNQGTQSLWISGIRDREQALKAYSGFIVIGEYVPEDLLQSLRDVGLPCVLLSFDRPCPDSIYLDFRPVMDQAALFLARQKCRRLVLIASNREEGRIANTWCRRIGFFQLLECYGITAGDCREVIVSPEDPALSKTLRNALLSSREKPAVITLTTVFNQPVADIMNDCGRKGGTDYELISLSHVPQELCLGAYADIKCELIIERLIDLFFRRYESSEPQIAEIIYPGFMIS